MPQGPEGPPKTEEERAFVRAAMLTLAPALPDLGAEQIADRALALLKAAREAGAFFQ